MFDPCTVFAIMIKPNIFFIITTKHRRNSDVAVHIAQTDTPGSS